MQPHGRLAGPRRALDAQRGRQVRTHEDVLVRLDRRDDVAHRACTWPLDLLGQQSGAGIRGGDEVLVLVGGDLAVPEPEPPPHRDAHRVAGPRAVERQRHRRAPVHDERLAAELARDVAASDVQAFVELRAQRRGVVEPSEEQGDRRVVLEGAHPPVQGLLEVLRGDRVAADGVLDACRGLAHASQRCAGLGEVSAFGGEDGIVRGHGPLQVR